MIKSAIYAHVGHINNLCLMENYYTFSWRSGFCIQMLSLGQWLSDEENNRH